MNLLLFISIIKIFHASAALIRRQETVYDAARIARRLFQESTVGTMATTYPADHPTLAGTPFSLQEYYSSCFSNGSLLLIFLPISRHSQNIMGSPAHSASISVWHSPQPSAKFPRVSLMGEVTVLRHDTILTQEYRECYLKAHPDAVKWLPDEPNSPHLSFWARFDPTSVYFVGGFGDEHYIGYIPLHIYQDSQPDPATNGLGVPITDRLQVLLNRVFEMIGGLLYS